jgi:hypothetical protein
LPLALDALVSTTLLLHGSRHCLCPLSHSYSPLRQEYIAANRQSQVPLYLYNDEFLLDHLQTCSCPAASIAAETEVTTDQLYSKITPTPPLPGFNVEGGSVFTNFAGAYNNGQFFFLVTDNLVYEKPGSDPVQFTFLYWCSDSPSRTSSMAAPQWPMLDIALSSYWLDTLQQLQQEASCHMTIRMGSLQHMVSRQCLLNKEYL